LRHLIQLGLHFGLKMDFHWSGLPLLEYTRTFRIVVTWTETPNLMALFFLLLVFGFVVLLIAAFIFPPTKWVQWLSSKDKTHVHKDKRK